MDSARGPSGVPPDARPSSAAPARPPAAHPPRRRKNHRGGKKKKSRRKSFAVAGDDIARDTLNNESMGEEGGGFYARPSDNLSTTSIDSEALLDHREQQPFMRPRRQSIMNTSSTFPPQTGSRLKTVVSSEVVDEARPESSWDERAPLLSSSMFQRAETFSGHGANELPRRSGPASRRDSSRASSRRKLPAFTSASDNYNVNFPPSVPGTPTMRASDRMDMSFGDVMLRDDLEAGQQSPERFGEDDESEAEEAPKFSPSLERRNTITRGPETDVCFPQGGLSDIADEETERDATMERTRSRRRRRKWPDLRILDEWSRFEKEGRSEERRAKKIAEPQLVNGRLRPVHRGWFRAEEDAPYRFTYFNEEFETTIHSQTISELVQPGGTFKELFIPDPPLLSDSSDSESEDEGHPIGLQQVLSAQTGNPQVPSRQPSLAAAHQSYFDARHDHGHFNNGDPPVTSSNSNKTTPMDAKSPDLFKSPDRITSPKPVKPPKEPKPPKYGDRPVWWLDVLSPTEAEMKVISKAFGIHPLTAEDIMVQEQREKVELFRHYYFVNYRSFDQDATSENFLEPVNVYVVVFREGVLSFHFSVTPHPANVRRRIRQLSDYMILSSDWISYAIIDDITDVFEPLIHNIEDEVDDIDDAILKMHSSDAANEKDDQKYAANDASSADAGRNMLRRVGDCRKKVMSLYRLLGSKADVIKGFAKRCNEHWEVAPRSEIGFYLGDIQDHIVTMTSNLSHYEKILARSHANYLAQINIRMNERQEQTADTLGKLTVLGTIVMPMNIVTGLWGMNVWVPGQDGEGDLRYFVLITASLALFGTACYLVAKRVYNIV
ncbi:hypothetical protein QBC47DRAFT_214771 [Echria macrotheca]|uniref:Uncharacterized protein n=1 Tax=Echria macrotheca TaxID=438768 RepID=A0AAJ0BGC6_9PEZI|nr:hypothetical protein QBC47DRAFT_214771 [Echria macrotheca]